MGHPGHTRPVKRGPDCSGLETACAWTGDMAFGAQKKQQVSKLVQRAEPTEIREKEEPKIHNLTDLGNPEEMMMVPSICLC